MSGIGHNGGPSLDSDEYPDSGGFVAIARSIRSHPIVGFGIKGPYAPAEAWIDLIMECRYREGRVVNGGVVMTINPGQLVGAVSWLAQRWDWTPKQVRTFLEKLEEDGMITKGYHAQKSLSENDDTKNGTQNGNHKGKQSHFITICNYEIYQFVQRAKGQMDGQTEGQSNGKQEANDGQTKGNNIRNNKETREQETQEKEISQPAPIEAAAPPSVVTREGEEHIGLGVIVNCETIRHPNFTIPLKAIELQVCGAVPMDRIKSISTGHAIQWATDIDAGQAPDKVVPKRIANYLASAIKREATKDLVGEIQVEKVRAAPAPKVIGGGKTDLKKESQSERWASALGLTRPPDASAIHSEILELTATEIKS